MSSDIAAQVRQVFAEVPSPRVISDQPNDEGASDHFAGTHWHDHGFEALDQQTTFALRMFTPQAVAFFLPAFLLAALERPESGLAEGVAGFLVPPKDNPRRASYWSWWSLLSP